MRALSRAVTCCTTAAATAAMSVPPRMLRLDVPKSSSSREDDSGDRRAEDRRDARGRPDRYHAAQHFPRELQHPGNPHRQAAGHDDGRPLGSERCARSEGERREEKREEGRPRVDVRLVFGVRTPHTRKVRAERAGRPALHDESERGRGRGGDADEQQGAQPAGRAQRAVEQQPAAEHDVEQNGRQSRQQTGGDEHQQQQAPADLGHAVCSSAGTWLPIPWAPIFPRRFLGVR
jgi:hypothetical protein